MRWQESDKLELDQKFKVLREDLTFVGLIASQVNRDLVSFIFSSFKNAVWLVELAHPDPHSSRRRPALLGFRVWHVHR